MNKTMKLIAAGLLAASVSAPAMAVTFQFDPANTKVEITNDPFCLGNCNLSFTADYTLSPFDVSLDTPTTVDFGSFSSGFGIGLNDATIKATVAFLQPGGSGSIDGEAKYGSFFGVLNAGKLTWQGPAEILAGGYKYTLAFENLKGVSTGSVDTNLTITASAVPEPATWLTMIAGFGMVGAAMRRQKKVAAVAA